MSNPKQLGAKQMFEQSLVYLYNSYREDGLDAEQAKGRVAQHIEEMYEKYQEKKVVPMKGLSISDPVRLVDDMLSDVKDYKPSDRGSKLFQSSIGRKLFHLKQILGGR